MSEATATLEAPASTAEPVPASNDRAEQKAPAVTSPAKTPAAAESSPPAQEKETPAEPVVDDLDVSALSPAEELKSLQDKYDAGDPLTTEQRSKLRSLQQSENDKAAAQRQAREQLAYNQQRIAKLAEEFPTRVISRLDAELQAAIEEGRSVSATLLKASIDQEVGELAKVGEPLFLMRWDAGVRNAVLEVGGSEATKRLEELAPGDFGAALGLLNRMWYERGQADSPDAKKLVKVQKELDGLKAGIEKTKTATGTKTTTGKDSAGDLTYQDYLRLPEAEKSKVPAEKFRALLGIG